ncbi:MAG: glycosyltransferase [Acidobacteriia bacterium]|jgi:glycosyltransferase involved in cell wall biosynthesis/phospholipid N-methyltransferase|nr:glycosyltransferase [Terriglobia bacterium]
MVSRQLSILVPLYNEEELVGELLRRVVEAPLPAGLTREIIVVNDCSKDSSAEVVAEFIAANPGEKIRLVHHEKNSGKGAAIRTAIRLAEGEFSVIQDSDLEYDPNDYAQLLRPLLSGKADVVFGSRFLISGERRVLYYWHSLANHLLTTLCNIVSDLNLTDMETCYKAFRTTLAQSIPIQSDRFGLEPELTIKFARRKARIYETPISYHGRTYAEGKKIGLKDAFEAVWVILRSKFTSQLYTDRGPEVLDAMALAPKFNKWMADTIAPWAGKKVLEIGAGAGNMTRQLAPKRKLYVATDLDPEHLALLRNGFGHRPTMRIAHLDATVAEHFVPFAGQLDTVVCLNVLEHIEDDFGTLQRIYSLLEPGGRLLLLVPNGPEAYGALDAAIGHFRRYTQPGLGDLVKKAGFELDAMLTFNRVSYPPWRFSGQVMKSATLSPMGMRIFDRLVWLFRKIDSSLPWPPASIIAIARRPD